MTDKNPFAVGLGKRRAATRSEAERRELSRLAHSLHWAPKTKQDGRITERVRAKLVNAIYEAVEGLFDTLRIDGRPRALVIHQGAAWTAIPSSKDFRIQQQRYPDSVIGIYDRDAKKAQVLDDIKTMPALESVLR